MDGQTDETDGQTCSERVRIRTHLMTSAVVMMTIADHVVTDGMDDVATVVVVGRLGRMQRRTR
ncbi:Uncharacterized protein APZ42_029364 [Daphnia magna]|uniref:Uncharacterized protein n=1 Tax=Daphnia magna TaxID=35525 RepID=A0A162D4L6_9CRUS|nr:Uncharacterized protein APZ42_029364 [Daphnia magna]